MNVCLSLNNSVLMYWQYIAKYFIYYYIISLFLIMVAFLPSTILPATISLMTTLIMVYIIKNITNLPRPYIKKGIKPKIFPPPTDKSFPSGHTASSISLATSIFIYNKPVGIIFMIFGLLLGVSRIRVSVHSKIDIIIGAILGAMITYIIHNNFNLI